MKILETERLRLRTLDQNDAVFYLALVNTPGFIAFIGDRGIRTVEAAAQAIVDGPMAMQGRLGHSIYLVEDKASGEPLGMSGLIKRDTLEHVDIGYAFLPEHCGKGYAYEAGQAVVAHARDEIGLPRLLAIVSPGNVASIGLLEKLGLAFERVVHLTAEDTGTRLYSRVFLK
ncbi:GNAT family N-acetyltransferase [Massilia sp. GCM10020059]|uniref:GNAT family N-acetyltransferase n=1 Tax=Massilia agrisoli TaxID=2892444 RepID=A0ABS8IRC6_9BURK|nr:GNAT family N-acetyltransferase [Massilia agrisoli]MCC6071124.1 GNAT family N-acetyltransferase [Massilia agrisoli]